MDLEAWGRVVVEDTLRDVNLEVDVSCNALASMHCMRLGGLFLTIEFAALSLSAIAPLDLQMSETKKWTLTFQESSWQHKLWDEIRFTEFGENEETNL